MYTKSNFATRIVHFIDRIIKCFIDSEFVNAFVYLKAFSTCLNKTVEELFQKFYQNSNVIIVKKQLHFSSHTSTCFKYNAVAIRQCRFDFSRFIVTKITMTEQNAIEIYKHYV